MRKQKVSNINVLVLGKIPPPTGGVTIHVSRLLKRLEQLEVDHEFYSLSNPVLSVLRKSLKHKVIHLHTSNPYFRFLFAVFCFFLGKKLIQTYHGNLGRFNFIRNFFDLGSVVFTGIPVVINMQSYTRALRLNRSSRLISSFIVPAEEESLPADLNTSLEQWKEKYKQIFCTNASCLKYDKDGEEVYGGSALWTIFQEISGAGLVFSDPSGEYQDFFNETFGKAPENIFMIPREHSFLEILRLSDCFIRASTTDGDSVSIKEALSMGVNVIASDCVDRPEGCLLYRTKDFSGLRLELVNFRKQDLPVNANYDEVEKITGLYI